MHASIPLSLSLVLCLSTFPAPSDARSWSLKPWARGREHSKLIAERKATVTRTVTVKATRTQTIWVDAGTAKVMPSSSSTPEVTTSTGSILDTVLPTGTETATGQASLSSSASTESTRDSASVWQTESVEVTGTPSFSSWVSEVTATVDASASSESVSSTAKDELEKTSTTAQTETTETSATRTASNPVTESAETVIPSDPGVSVTESSSSVTTEIPSSIPTSADVGESSSAQTMPTTSAEESETGSAEPTSTLLPPNLVLRPTSTSVSASSSGAIPEPTELVSTGEQESQIFTMPLATGTESSSSQSPSTGSSSASQAGSASPSSSSAYQPDWNAPGAIPSYPPFVSASRSSTTPASSVGSSVPTNSSTAANASQSAYIPNGQAPGAVPAYPSFVSASRSSVAQASVTESSLEASSSTISPATSSAYIPNGQAPGAIPAYPSFVSSPRSSSAQASQTDGSTIASTTSDAIATQTQPSETIFESATQSTSMTSSWWSSWFSASSAASDTASISTTAASETASTSATVSETATLSTSASPSDAASTSATTSSSSAADPIVTGRTGLSTTPLADRMTAGYYPDWTVWTYPVSALDWSKLDVVDFAFAIPDVNFQLQFLQYNSLDTLRELVTAGHAAGKKVRLSIGGWTGSVYFSAAVSNDANRQTFANNIATVYRDYSLDGIDLDWEYPGGGGAWGNGQSSSDTDNFLIFLQVLRKTLPPQALLSSATQVLPFKTGSSGAPSTDISGFAQVLDWITIMNYDIWSSSNDNPGPNAPLGMACGSSDMPWANAEAAVKAWELAGMPSNQIMLGIAAYGYLQMSSANRLRTRRRDLDTRAMVTVYNPNGESGSGQINFASLIDQKALKRDPTTGNWIGDNGFTREWDDCSSTPWLKSPYSGQLITYDDPQSISMKAQFARQARLRGTSVWEITGDMGGSNWSLLTAARSGLGI